MFYEDIRIGESTELGSTTFTRAAIMGYGRDFDPRVLARGRAGEVLTASGLDLAAPAMRRLVETRKALRAALAARGESLPELGVSPGFKDMRCPQPVQEGDVVAFIMESVSKRETSKQLWGLVAHTVHGFNQRGEEALVFSGVALVPRRGQANVNSLKGMARILTAKRLSCAVAPKFPTATPRQAAEDLREGLDPSLSVRGEERWRST